MKIETIRQYQKILILGFGVEGKATVTFIKTVHPTAEIATADETDGEDYLRKQLWADLVVKTPGIRKETVTRPYTTATNIFFANCKGKTIGVTGTKGKSTTASLIYKILSRAHYPAHLAGNIGNPLLTELAKSNQHNDIFICELSSYQLDDINDSPDIAVFINIFPDHMTYHGNFEKYFQAKSRIIAYAGPSDFFIYNPRFKQLQWLASQTEARAVPFVELTGELMKSSPLLGAHNRQNLEAAATVAKVLGISDETVKKAITHFQPLPHRLEKVGTFDGITFYDDGAATTPEATLAALRSLDGVKTLFLGGEDRGYNFSELCDQISEAGIENLVLFPDSGQKILKILTDIKMQKRFNILQTESMEEAVKFAYQRTPVGSICLLSTASPSYSLWKNFNEKGDLFQKLVKKLA